MVLYLTKWGMSTAVRQSAALIRNGSALRVATYAEQRSDTCHINAITVDSIHSSGFGQGKIVHGYLLGAPIQNKDSA